MPPTADADAVLAREQAAEAAVLWAVGDFDAAQQTLQRLEATLPSDARVQLNLWVAGYYADAGSSLDSVAKELEAWLKAHPSDPGADVTQHNSHAVAAVNYGLILFLQQQHASALAVLEPLFEHVDILQDGTALCLCGLLLEVYLDSCQLPKAVDILHYLQGLTTPAVSLLPLGGGQEGPSEAAAGGASGSSSSSKGPGLDSADRSPRKQQQQQDAGAVAAAGRVDGSSGGQDGAGSQQQGGAVVPLDQALPHMSKTKGTRMQEVFELVRQQGGKAPGHDLAPLLHLYKARLALACHNHKAAKKEVRGLLSCDPDSPAALLLKAQLETCRQQPRKALKTLGPLLTAQHQHTIRCRLQLLNLLAAVHHQLDKHHLAALYLTTALDLHTEAQQQQQNPQAPTASKPPEPQQRKQQGKWPKNLWQQKGSSGRSSEGGGPQGVVSRQSHWLLQDMSDALSYNLGLQQLALHDWQAASECFEAAASKYFTLPQLWLRWAEACIGLYHQQQQQQQVVSGQQEADGSGSSGGGAPGTGKGAAKHGKGQQQAQGKKQQQPQPQQQQHQQQQDCNPEQLLEQAAAHINTGLVLLQEQQAAAAKQLEAATAAAAAAIAAGEPPPELAGQPLWPTSSAAAAVGAGDGEAAATGAVSSSAATAGPSSSAAAADSTGAGPSTTTAAAGMSGTVLGSWPAEAALLAPELAAVRQSLLANRAYVALVRGHPAEALSAAQELLACSSMSPAQHYLGSSYAAEALCHLGRVDEAGQLLQAHMQLFMPNSSSSAVSLSGLPADHQHQQHQQHQQQLGLSLAGPAGTAAGGVPESSSSASALAVLAGTAPGPHMHVGVGGVAGGPAAQLAHTTAGSTKSFDGSCISCSRGACGASGASASGPGLGPREQALLLHNMSTVLVLQGDYQEGSRHAAMAADLLYTSAAQQGPGGGAQPVLGNMGL